MTAYQNDTHAEQVRVWEEKNCTGLRSEQIAQLYARAVQAIENRSLVTLSSVTVKVVVDRALYESQGKFPVLAAVNIEGDRLNLTPLIEKCAGQDLEELRKALRFLLTEVLSVLGNITADVLTAPLYKKLAGVQGLRAMNPPNSNRGDS